MFIYLGCLYDNLNIIKNVLLLFIYLIYLLLLLIYIFWMSLKVMFLFFKGLVQMIFMYLMNILKFLEKKHLHSGPLILLTSLMFCVSAYNNEKWQSAVRKACGIGVKCQSALLGFLMTSFWGFRESWQGWS